jgi:hypothetical protein
VESRNAKFLENVLISGRYQFQDISSDKGNIDVEPSTSSDQLIVIHSTPQVQTGIRQPINEVPRAADNNLVNEDVQSFLKLLSIYKESLLEKVSRVYIASDYMIYLLESDYNISAESDPKTFSLIREN